ncbi:MAG: peptidylprolyl isomerase [Rickettsiales bacterium]
MLIRIFSLLLCLTFPVAAQAAPSGLGIAAVLNNEAITSYDVDARMRFVIATTKLTNSAETIKRVRPQVIRSLVDERLQLAEAKRLNIEISDDEVTKAIAGLESQRGMKPGAIFSMLKRNRVPKETFINQIRAQLAWNSILIKKVRPTVDITEEEVELAQKRLSIPVVKQEMEIAVLTLPVDKPSNEAEMRQLIDKLSKEMRGGASFEELSRQFSSGAAAAGGKVQTFWVRPEQLHPIVGKALARAKVGTITPPLRTPDGFTIVKVYNTRALENEAEKEQQVTLKDILLKLKADAENKEAEVLLTIGEEVARNPGSCEEKGIAGVDDLDEFNIEVAMKTERMSSLSPAVKTIVENLSVGEISAPFATDEGIQLYMLCGRGEAPAALVDVERVQNVIYKQKMELAAQKYIRDLRRDAYLEIR